MGKEKNEKRIIIPLVIGSEGRTKEEIEYYRKIVKEIEEEKETKKRIKEIEEKLEKGETLSLEEAKFLFNQYIKKIEKEVKEKTEDLKTGAEKIEEEVKKIDEKATLETHERAAIQEIIDQGEKAREVLTQEVNEINPENLPCWVDRSGPENEVSPEEFARQYPKAIEEAKKILDELSQQEELKELIPEELIYELYQRIKFQGKYDKIKGDLINEYYRKVSGKLESSPDKLLMALEYLLNEIEIQKAKRAEESLKKEAYIRNVRIDTDDLIQEYGELISIYDRDPKTGRPILKEAVVRDLITYGLVRDFVLDDETYQRWENLKKEANKLRREGKEKEAQQKIKEYLKELFKFNKDLERVCEKFYSPARLTDPRDIELYKRLKKAKESTFEELLKHYRGNKEYLKKRLEKYGIVNLDTSHLPIYLFKWLRFLERVQWLRPEAKKIPIRKKEFVEVPTKEKEKVEAPPKTEVPPSEEKKEEVPISRVDQESIRERINAGKIIAKAKEEGKKPEEIEKLLAQAKYAELKNFKEDKELCKKLEKLIESLVKEISEEEKKAIIQELKDKTGLEEKEIEEALVALEKRFEQILASEIAKKEKLPIHFGKTAFSVGSIVLGSLLLGPFGAVVGAGLSGIIRATEAHFVKKVEEKRLKEEILKSGELKEKLLEELIAKLAFNKQEQIDKRGEELTQLEKEYQKAIDDWLKYYEKHQKDIEEGKIDKLEVPEYKNYLKIREKLKLEYAVIIKNYLIKKWPGISEEELNKRVNEALALFEEDENNYLFGQEVQRKNPGLFTKINRAIDRFFEWKFIKGGKTEKEKAITGTIFAIGGVLIRHIPGLDRVFAAYGGAKIGEAVVEAVLNKKKEYEILKEILSDAIKNKEDLSDEVIERIRVQLFAEKDDFGKKYPTDYAELRHLIDQIEQMKIKKAKDLKSHIEERNDKLEKTFIEKEKREKRAILYKNLARIIGGAIAALVLPELMKGKKSPEKKLTPKKEIKPELTRENVFTAGKGDNDWTIAERFAEKNIPGFNELNRAQKDYVIDKICDEIAKNPGRFGFHVHNGIIITHEGSKYDFSSITNEFIEKAMKEATGLTPQQIADISKYREIYGEILSKGIKGIKEATDSQLAFLVKTASHGPGGSTVGVAIFNEFQHRVQKVFKECNTLISQVQETVPKVNETIQEATRLSSSLDSLRSQLNEAIARESGFLGFFRKLFTGSKVPGLREQFLIEHSRYNSTLDRLKELVNSISGRFKSLDDFLKRLEILDPEKAKALKQAIKEIPDFKEILRKLIGKRGYLI
jgi:hypothetical protein